MEHDLRPEVHLVAREPDTGERIPIAVSVDANLVRGVADALLSEARACTTSTGDGVLDLLLRLDAEKLEKTIAALVGEPPAQALRLEPVHCLPSRKSNTTRSRSRLTHKKEDKNVP